MSRKKKVNSILRKIIAITIIAGMLLPVIIGTVTLFI